MILRKILAVRHLLHSDEPIKKLAERLRLNMRLARLKVGRCATLLYMHDDGFPFAVIADVPETRSVYINADSYQQVESRIIASWLVCGDTAIDCGPNVGVMTALMAGSVGDHGCVVSIEASPYTYRRLQRVMDVLGLKQVDTLNRCVGDNEENVSFRHNKLNSEASAIACKYDERETGPLCEVRSITIDSLVDRTAPPALIKLDIEGAEPLALRGAKRLLASERLPLLVIEVYPRGLKRLGFGPGDILSQLPLEHYELWHVNISWPNEAPEFPRNIPLPLSNPYDHPWPFHTNLIAVPRIGLLAGRRQQLSHILQTDGIAPNVSQQLAQPQ